MPKRILHIFGRMGRGGAEIRTVSLMKGMSKYGFYFDYVALSGLEGELDQTIRDHGGKLFYWKNSIATFIKIYRLLKTENYHAVHSHVAYVSGLFVLIGWLAGTKVRITHFRNTTDGVAPTPLRSLRNFFLKLLIKRFSTNVLGVCRGALQGFIGDNWKKSKKNQVIYNGFEVPQVQQKQEFWKQYAPDFGNGIAIINVSRMAKAKNHVGLVEIFASFKLVQPDSHLFIIGKEEPEIKSKINSKAKELGVESSISILGIQSDPYPFYQNADLMLFPSLWEGLPGSVIEAASLGTPVVCSSLPGTEEISEMLPCVRTVKLAEDHDVWLSVMQQLLGQAGCRHTYMNQFNESAFLIDSNIEALADVYASK